MENIILKNHIVHKSKASIKKYFQSFFTFFQDMEFRKGGHQSEIDYYKIWISYHFKIDVITNSVSYHNFLI